MALQRRSLRDCLSEELRRLDPDQIYEAALGSLPDIRRGRAPAPAKPPAKPSAERPAKSAAERPAKASGSKAASRKSSDKETS